MTKQVETILTEVESHRFSAIANVASSLKTFLRVVQSQPTAQRLANELRSREVQDLVYQRALKLAEEQIDVNYENPRDVALAVYAWLLNAKNKLLARSLAERIRECPQCWWARKVAQQVLDSHDHFSNVRSVVQVVHGKPLVSFEANEFMRELGILLEPRKMPTYSIQVQTYPFTSNTGEIVGTAPENSYVNQGANRVLEQINND